MNEAVMQAFENFEPGAFSAWNFETEDRRNFIRTQIAHWPSYALPDLKNPTVLCGVVHAHGVGEFWMVAGKDFRRSAPVVLQQLRELIRLSSKVLHLRRVSMSVDANREDAKLWARRLGFTLEAELKNASPRGCNLQVYLWPEEKGELCDE